MLTLDDLDHFNDRSMAHLFAPSTRRADADSLARLARIVACLNFCRDIPDAELVEGGLHGARRAVKSVLRSQQRKRRIDAEQLIASLEEARGALGEPAESGSEPADVVPERHAVEAEIQAAAVKLAEVETCDAQLVGSLARGEFELRPSSNFAPLLENVGKFAGVASIDVDLAVDSTAPTQLVRVHLVVESGFWRWVAQDGCCMSRNGDPAVFLPPEDAVVQALLSGLALRGGRAVTAWAEAVGEQQQIAEARSA